MNIQDAIRDHNKQAVGRWWLLKYFGGLALGIFFCLAALGAPLAQHHYVMPMIVYLLLSAAGRFMGIEGTVSRRTLLRGLALFAHCQDRAGVELGVHAAALRIFSFDDFQLLHFGFSERD